MIDIFGTTIDLPNFTTVVAIINFFIAIFIIFMERKNPTTTLAWILVLFFIPVVGLFFYLFFAQNIDKSKVFKINDSTVEFCQEHINKQIEQIDTGTYRLSNTSVKDWKHLVTLNQKYGDALLTQDNDVEIIYDGKKMYNALLSDIMNAEKSIDILYFIIKHDPVGDRFIELLTEKAREGVKVRLLMDAMGCVSIKPRYLKEFIAAGGEYDFFFKPKLRVINLQMNYRNHRKIAVIDNEIGYVGGFNIAKEYLGFKKKFGYWRDTQLRIVGSATEDLHARMLMDWNVATGQKTDVESCYNREEGKKNKVPVQIVSCGPDSQKEEIKRSMMKMITYAEKSVYIQTPYFVPDSSILESLKMAAQSGVDVRIMIPCMPDHIFVYWATYSYVGELLRSGARAYIYDNGFLHAKTLTVDEQVATVGSCNFDRRSFRLNFETNAVVYDKKTAKNMETKFLEDINDCHELTYADYKARSKWIVFKESISRLLSDIL